MSKVFPYTSSPITSKESRPNSVNRLHETALLQYFESNLLSSANTPESIMTFSRPSRVAWLNPGANMRRCLACSALSIAVNKFLTPYHQSDGKLFEKKTTITTQFITYIEGKSLVKRAFLIPFRTIDLFESI
jgi:hypothetical protein